MKAPGAMPRGPRQQAPRPQVPEEFLAMAAAHMNQLGKPVFSSQVPQTTPILPQVSDAQDIK